MQKRPSYHFFHFTRKEKNGTIFILFIIILLFATPFIYSLIFKEKSIDARELKNEMASLKIKPADSLKNNYEKIYPEDQSRYAEINNNSPASLFYFDPNTLSEAGWKKLGLTDKTISTIQNYLSKGGRFREPADIKKIWGLHPTRAEKLLPYVRIEQTTIPVREKFIPAERKIYSPKTTIPIDINNADSVAYISLPGIGPGFAKRILKFRDKLGGFYKAEQVSETFGLPDSVFQKIKNYLQVSAGDVRKININTATLDELKEHPYIRYQLANAIIQFRTQHGNFETVNDIKKLMIINDDIFMKISPYLTVR